MIDLLIFIILLPLRLLYITITRRITVAIGTILLSGKNTLLLLQLKNFHQFMQTVTTLISIFFNLRIKLSNVEPKYCIYFIEI